MGVRRLLHDPLPDKIYHLSSFFSSCFSSRCNVLWRTLGYITCTYVGSTCNAPVPECAKAIGEQRTGNMVEERVWASVGGSATVVAPLPIEIT